MPKADIKVADRKTRHFISLAATTAAHCAGDFVNYATLGYGDVLPVERWRLLGPLTAMNGMLLFGWSTAVIFFEVLRRTLVRTLDYQIID